MLLTVASRVWFMSESPELLHIWGLVMALFLLAAYGGIYILLAAYGGICFISGKYGGMYFICGKYGGMYVLLMQYLEGRM